MNYEDLEKNIETACNNINKRIWNTRKGKRFILRKVKEYFLGLLNELCEEFKKD